MMTAAEIQTVNRAIGRIFSMASRPAQPGDVAEYERCRNLCLDLTEGVFDLTDRAPDYIRDRNCGATGD